MFETADKCLRAGETGARLPANSWESFSSEFYYMFRDTPTRIGAAALFIAALAVLLLELARFAPSPRRHNLLISTCFSAAAAFFYIALAARPEAINILMTFLGSFVASIGIIAVFASTSSRN